MPLDFKRINGPDKTYPYQLFTPKDENNLNKIRDGIISLGIRADNRKNLEHRKIFLNTGIITQAKGSAYMEVGKTKVIVSIFDPREIQNRTEYTPKGELYCEFRYATFSCALRKQHQQDFEEKQNSFIIKQALEPCVCLHEFPNFQVDVYIFVLENDGSALSAAITCASVALSHAGVPMYDIATAATIGILDSSTFIVDPTFEEEKICHRASNEKSGDSMDHGIIVGSLLSTHQQISQFHHIGNITIENIGKTIKMLLDLNKEIVPCIEKILVKHIIKHQKMA